MKDVYCRILCQSTLSMKDADQFRHSIARQYHHNWIIDNLPAASIMDSDQFITTQYVGFPVGYQDEKSNHYIYNHVNIILDYHQVDADAYRIVGFYVEPISVKHSFKNGEKWDGKATPPPLDSCSDSAFLEYSAVKEHQKVPTSGNILFT